MEFPLPASWGLRRAACHGLLALGYPVVASVEIHGLHGLPSQQRWPRRPAPSGTGQGGWHAVLVLNLLSYSLFKVVLLYYYRFLLLSSSRSRLDPHFLCFS